MVDLETVILSEVSQTEEEKYNLKSDTNELTYKPRKIITDLENEFMVAQGKDEGRA